MWMTKEWSIPNTRLLDWVFCAILSISYNNFKLNCPHISLQIWCRRIYKATVNCLTMRGFVCY